MTPLEKFFSLAWRAFLDQEDWAESDMQDSMLEAGLAERGFATAEDVAKMQDVEAGDGILVLTPVGREALAVAKI